MNKKIIFLHIPKTAGTSLREILRRQCASDAFLHLDPPLTPEKLELVRTRKGLIKIISGHLYYGVSEPLGVEANYFTFLRNPVDRVISFWNHQIKYPTSEFHREAGQGLSLKDFILSHRTLQTNNHMTRILVGNVLPDMLNGRNNEIFSEKYLSCALNNVRSSFRFVGFMEYFEESVKAMLQEFGWRYDDTLPQLNKLNSTKAGIDEETMSLVANYNNLDVRLYETLLQQCGWGSGLSPRGDIG